MIIVLTNFPNHYEVEQLTRMFKRDVVVKSEKRNLTYDYKTILYVRQNKFKIFIALQTENETYKALIFPVQDKNKNQLNVCTQIYKFYLKAFNKELPWGILTGVRPVRLFRNLYNIDKILQNVESEFANSFYVTPAKIQLCKEIFTLQRPIIDNISKKDFSLYISIPFCPTRCSYCSFVSTPLKNAQGIMDEYVDKLCKEIDYTAHLAGKHSLTLKTIYIGGGTPTAISANQLEKIMLQVLNSFDISHVLEYTVEAGRADCTTMEKLEIIKRYKATRVSINPQTFSDNVLKAIGRSHTHKDFLNCFNMAREMGFKTINTDLIAGLPLDTQDGFERSVRGCVQLGAENITIHTLTLKRASTLVMKNSFEGEVDVSEMLEKNKIITDNGYLPYYMYRQKSTLQSLENIGFSKPGHESLYNIYIMEEVQTIISCGAGGVSKAVNSPTDIQRIYNYKYPIEYIKNFDTILKRKQEIIDICSL